MGERSAEHPSERRGAEGIARAESAGGDRDLERVLRDALSRLARSAECDAAVVWRRGADRDALALDASAESPVPGSADAYTELAHLARATDLEGTGSARLGTIARDFVVSGDITWNTTTGLSGCGWVLRSDGNEDAFNQYLTIATRGGNGRVIFAPMLEGERSI